MQMKKIKKRINSFFSNIEGWEKKRIFSFQIKKKFERKKNATKNKKTQNKKTTKGK